MREAGAQPLKHDDDVEHMRDELRGAPSAAWQQTCNVDESAAMLL